MQLERGLEKLNFAWFEEPLALDDIAAMGHHREAGVDLPLDVGHQSQQRLDREHALQRAGPSIVVHWDCSTLRALRSLWLSE